MIKYHHHRFVCREQETQNIICISLVLTCFAQSGLKWFRQSASGRLASGTDFLLSCNRHHHSLALLLFNPRKKHTISRLSTIGIQSSCQVGVCQEDAPSPRRTVTAIATTHPEMHASIHQRLRVSPSQLGGTRLQGSSSNRRRELLLRLASMPLTSLRLHLRGGRRSSLSRRTSGNSVTPGEHVHSRQLNPCMPLDVRLLCTMQHSIQ